MTLTTPTTHLAKGLSLFKDKHLLKQAWVFFFFCFFVFWGQPQWSLGTSSAVEALRLTESAYNNGDFKQTQGLIFSTIKENPHTYLLPEFLLLLSYSYLGMGEPQQAQVILKSVKERYPLYEKEPNVLFLESLIFEKSGDLDKALMPLRELKSDRALFRSGALLERTGQSFAAVSKFRELEQLYPESSFLSLSRLALANSYFTLGEFEESKKHLENATGRSSVKEEFFRTYLSGSIEHKLGNNEEATKWFSHISAQNQPDLEPFANTMQGLIALKSHHRVQAEEILTRNLTTSNIECLVRSALGLIQLHLESSQPASAISVCNTVLPKLAQHDQRHQILLLRGISYERSDQVSLALQDFQEVVSSNNRWSTPALVLMGQALWLARDTSRLTTDYRKAVQDFRKGDSIQFKKIEYSGTELETCELLIGQANLSIKNYKEAEEIFRQILTRTPSPRLTAQTVGGLASSLVFQKKFDEAEKSLDELMVRFGEDRDVVKFGLLTQAHLFWNKEHFPGAEEKYTRYTQMFPEDIETPHALYLLGRSQEKQSKFEEATVTWNDLRQQHPDSPYAFRALLRLASVTHRQGLDGLSQELFQQIAQSENSSLAENALLQMGLNELRANRFVEAIRTFHQLTSRFPLSHVLPEVTENLKTAYQQVALTEPSCLEDLATEFVTSPYGGEAFYWMGLGAFDKAELTKAIPYFQKVIVDFPRSPSSKQAFFYKAQAEYQLKNYKEALVTLGQFLKTSPDHDFAVLARLQRGRALQAVGFLDEALFEFKKITEIAPHSGYAAAALLNWGQVLGQKNDFEKQTEIYEMFLKTFPQDKAANDVVWNLANLHRRFGAYQVAVGYYQKVKPIDGVVSQQELDATMKSLGALANQGSRQ